jgi:hypothetical protein
MEQYNFYHVKVGRQTKSGNLETFVERVVKSTMNRNELLSHFYKQYVGFTVEVWQIDAVSVEEIDPQVRQKEVKKLTETKVTKTRRIDRKIHYTDLPPKSTEVYDELVNLQKEVNDKMVLFRRTLKAELDPSVKAIGEVDTIKMSVFEDVNRHHIPYSIKIHGELTETLEETND